MNIPVILNMIRPGARWVLNGESYDGLVWLDEGQAKPTLQEIQAVTEQEVQDFIKMRNIIRRVDSENGASSKLVYKILFNHENRIRDLEARQRATKEQFRQFLIDQLLEE
jgi:hypothetical protein